MTKPYDYAVFIGRFQPFHNGHLEVYNKASEIAEKVIMLVGSSNRARSTRNPWTYEERRDMIEYATSATFHTGPLIAQLPDAAYDDVEWVSNVQSIVRGYTSHLVAPRVCLVGDDKDNSTYYLRMFPQWTFVQFNTGIVDGADQPKCNATAIREVYFDSAVHLPEVEPWLPPQITSFIKEWRQTTHWGDLMEAEVYYRDYRAKWGHGPHVTADACVVQSGHVLLVERGEGPGTGLLALPGGFLEPSESLLQGALRELREETGLSISPEVAQTYLKAQATYDDPHRSQRSRIITTAFLIELPPGRLIPVEGADDAQAARWVEISSLKVAGASLPGCDEQTDQRVTEQPRQGAHERLLQRDCVPGPALQ